MTVLAIDGPGGSGKSTVASALAARLGWVRLDTGAMYRALTLEALRKGVDPDDGEALGALARGLELRLGERLILDGSDVTAAIRSPEVDAAVSRVAAHPAVRSELVRRQRAWLDEHPTAVVEGRDIGSVVAPDAALKVYLDAHPKVRAARRAEQEPGRGAAALAARDHLDSTRTASPLAVPEGALVIDSSEIAVDEVVARVLEALEERRIVPPPARSPAAVDAAPSAASSPAGAAPPGAAPPPVHPPTPAELAFYAACRVVAVGASRAYFPGPVVGAEHVPAEGPFVLAPSHRSYVDWLIAARVTKRRLRYLVKGEVWRMRSVGRLIEALGAFPVQRGTTDRLAFNRALGVLEVGEPLVVFPEGTRKSGPEIGELQEGAAYLALRAGVPIVPVGLGGTEKAMPRGSRIPRPGPVRIVVGEPILPTEVLGTPEGPGSGRIPRSATRALTKLLGERLQALLDEAEQRGGAATRAI